MRCRLCGNTNLSLDYTQGNRKQYHFYRCKNCGLVNYDLSDGIDQTKYEISLNDPLDPTSGSGKEKDATFRFITSHIRKKPCRAMEIGCGHGRLLYLLHTHGWEVSGLDLSPVIASRVKERLGFDVRAENFLEYVPNENEKYDVVILRHVLEHLPDSTKALQKINGLLKVDGLAMLEFPNIDGWDIRFKIFMEKTGLRKKKYKDDYVPGHCNEFNKKAYTYLLKKTGFDLVTWETYSSKPLFNALYRLIPVGSKVMTIIRKTAELPG